MSAHSPINTRLRPDVGAPKANEDPLQLLMMRLSDPALRKQAEDGYSLFFNTFIMDDPNAYISFHSFCYKYLANPYLLPDSASIEYVDGQPAAMIWLQGTPLVVDGNPRLMATSGDYCAIEAGFGMPAIAALLRQRDTLREQDIPIRYGEPGDKGFAVQRRYGYQLLGEFETWEATPEQLEVSAATHANAAQSEGIEFSVADSCPFDEDDFSAINSFGPPVKVLREKAYYAWRMDCLPDRSFCYATARKDGELIGYLVAEKIPWYLRIADWMLLCGEDQGETVLGGLLAQLSSLEGRRQVRNLNTANHEQRAFQKNGFSPRKNNDGSTASHRFCIMPSGKDADSIFTSARNWKMCEADFDYHFNSHVVR